MSKLTDNLIRSVSTNLFFVKPARGTFIRTERRIRGLLEMKTYMTRKGNYNLEERTILRKMTGLKELRTWHAMGPVYRSRSEKPRHPEKGAFLPH